MHQGNGETSSSPVPRDSGVAPASHRVRTRSRGERTDGELLETALGEGIEARRAASRLLARYQDRVYAWCHRHVRDPERAADLTQEVLITAYRKQGTYEGRSRFSSWLFAITRNRCISELRRPGLLLDEDMDPNATAASGSPEQALADKLGEEAIVGLIRDTLDVEEQNVVWLRCFERMPIDEITRVLAIQEASGARAVLQRARRRLRRALEARAVEEAQRE